MDRIRDSRRGGTCSSSSNSSANRRPTCYSNEEEGQVGLRGRAARKERERERLRELLNRGRKKRRRISSDKLTVSPAPSPAIVICASVPRKPRSVGSRRKGKSWVFKGSNARPQPPSAPATGKSSPLVQNEAEMEIAEVLFGLQKKESPPGVENESQSVAVRNSSVHLPLAEPSSINAASEHSKDESAIHNQDRPVLKQELSTVEEGAALNLAVEAKSKRQGKFVIDLMKPPPVECWPDEVEVARSSSSPKITSQDIEVEGGLSSVKKEVVYEKQPRPTVLIKAELRDLDQDHTKDEPKLLFQKQRIKTWPNTSISNCLPPAQIGSLLPLELTGLSTGPLEGGENHVPLPVLKPPDFRLIQSRPKRCTTHRTIAQSIYRHQQMLHDDSDLLGSERIFRNRQQGLVPGSDLNCARDRAQAIEVYLRTSQKGNSLRPASTSVNVHKHASHQIPMAGPFVFPFSQNQTVTARQSEIPLSASSPASMRFSHPNGAPFLAVLPEFMGKKVQQTSGRKNVQPLPFFDRQLHPAQMFYPVQIQQPKNFPFSTSAVDTRTSRSQRKMTEQSPHAGQGDSASLFPFAYSRQSNSTNAGGPDLNISLAPNSVCPQRFLENSNLGSQTLRAGHQMQHRNPQVLQNMSGGEFMQAEKLSFARQTALSTRTHLSGSNPLAAPFRLQNQQQQMLHAMATTQLRLPPANAAKVSKDFAFFSGNLFDRSKSSHSLQQRASDIKHASEVFP